jgi:hypothetical protein
MFLCPQLLEKNPEFYLNVIIVIKTLLMSLKNSHNNATWHLRVFNAIKICMFLS